MATVGIWKVCSSLGQVIKYTTNKDKTDLSNYKNLDQSLKYIENDFKTENQLFVDGINCNPKNALKEMVEVKKKFMKTDGVLGWHAYHSYRENEVTPELAHQVGLEVAKEMWGDRFQIVVSTHINARCIHNHFVINSVSFIDGKKYYANRTTYAELRRISNEICKEYGLSTLEEKKTKSGINYLNYQNKSINYTNYYKTAKVDIDAAISEARSYQEFINILKNMGYKITNRSNKLSICGKDYKRNIRIERYFGLDYSIENINKQIQGLYLPIKKTYYKNEHPRQDYIKTLLKPKYKSFYAMYIRYCNILNIYPTYAKKHTISKTIKEDLKILDKLSNQAILLEKNNIETEEDFINFLNGKEKELDSFKNQKEDLWKKYKKVDTAEQENIKQYINTLNQKIETLKQEVSMCEDIQSRKNNIKQNLKEIDEQEMINYEHIK